MRPRHHPAGRAHLPRGRPSWSVLPRRGAAAAGGRPLAGLVWVPEPGQCPARAAPDGASGGPRGAAPPRQ
eukprot:4914955-Pyramimonas_sp.AAC.1